jgi:hypothetical protein
MLGFVSQKLLLKLRNHLKVSSKLPLESKNSEYYEANSFYIAFPILAGSSTSERPVMHKQYYRFLFWLIFSKLLDSDISSPASHPKISQTNPAFPIALATKNSHFIFSIVTTAAEPTSSAQPLHILFKTTLLEWEDVL